eukprot:PLAT13741.1.p1 GENE.PLAT13741.1~~PLAT13741.1.p1  ORF type:complete len:402 (+),score=220.75 PLAT13741.1:1301-2506(+)
MEALLYEAEQRVAKRSSRVKKMKQQRKKKKKMMMMMKKEEVEGEGKGARDGDDGDEDVVAVDDGDDSDGVDSDDGEADALEKEAIVAETRVEMRAHYRRLKASWVEESRAAMEKVRSQAERALQRAAMQQEVALERAAMDKEVEMEKLRIRGDKAVRDAEMAGRTALQRQAAEAGEQMERLRSVHARQLDALRREAAQNEVALRASLRAELGADTLAAHEMELCQQRRVAALRRVGLCLFYRIRMHACSSAWRAWRHAVYSDRLRQAGRAAEGATRLTVWATRREDSAMQRSFAVWKRMLLLGRASGFKRSALLSMNRMIAAQRLAHVMHMRRQRALSSALSHWARVASEDNLFALADRVQLLTTALQRMKAEAVKWKRRAVAGSGAAVVATPPLPPERML